MSIIQVRRGSGAIDQEIQIRGHRILSDSDEKSGGRDAGPSPHDLLAASLAACTSMTLTMYAARKSWDVSRLEVEVQITREDATGTVFSRTIRGLDAFGNDERARLLEIANRCPVHRVLSGEIEIQTELKPS